MTVPLLQATGLTKSYPGVRALKGVGLAVHGGEVLAVIGENGAGKSTLMKILAGVQRPDSGSIDLRGARVELRSVQAAQALGIAYEMLVGRRPFESDDVMSLLMAHLNATPPPPTTTR